MTHNCKRAPTRGTLNAAVICYPGYFKVRLQGTKHSILSVCNAFLTSKFMTLHTDVCHYCEGFRVAIVRAVAETEKARLTQDFKEHSEEAQMERKYYLDCIERAK